MAACEEVFLSKSAVALRVFHILDPIGEVYFRRASLGEQV